jgi:hypothetical protein
MSCEKERPNLTPRQRRQYHALIRMLAGRLVARNRLRKLETAESHSHVSDVQVSSAEPGSSDRQRAERPAISGGSVSPGVLRDLLRQAERQTSDVFANPTTHEEPDEWRTP